jgi:hypothetical protein
MAPQNIETGTVVGVNVVRQPGASVAAIELTGFVVGLSDGREVVAKVDSRPSKSLKRRARLVGCSVEVDLGDGTEPARILAYGRGL